jgi:hypothetical protein
MPSLVAISCPRCCREARFEQPFEFYREDASDLPHLIKWNNWLVRERFPSVFQWTDDDNPFKSLFWGTPKRQLSEYPIWGVVSCPQCTLQRKHRLRWPTDAYYAVPVKNEVLWAWDRETLILVRDHVTSLIRAKRCHPLLKYLPRHFLVGKHRAAVVKAINAKLVPGDA